MADQTQEPFRSSGRLRWRFGASRGIGIAPFVSRQGYLFEQESFTDADGRRMPLALSGKQPGS